MTEREIDVLREIACGARGGPLPKSYFNTFPGSLRVAKKLMWMGFIEPGGTLCEFVVLTPAGRACLDAE